MPTRLKRLELHGFKSFATPTSFVFDPGITAVIGPNGSGKSNIADAVRWVLGEQSYSQLRGRKTEDIIFAGGASRAPNGMAEVSLTLDNSSGELPLAFAEITVVRRAFRSGENQYLINGSRVRLKDVLQITASLGQAYTVIGQGLVDAVLSQQPEDRRGLFEHAAGITGLRLKRVEAERSLNEAQSNTTRLEDLLREIEPRLRSLERAARQAREYEEVAGKLTTARLALATFDYQAASHKLLQARESLAALDAATAELEREIGAASEKLQAMEEAVKASGEELERARRAASEHEREHRDAGHQLAIEQERLVAHQQRSRDAGQSREALNAEVEGIGAELETADRAAQEARRLLDETTEALAAVEQQASEERRKRSQLTAELHAVEQRVDQAEREAIAKEARRRALEQQHDDLEAQAGQLGDSVRSRQEQLAQLREEIDRLAARRASLSGDLAQHDQELGQIDQEIATARQAAEACREPVERLRQRLAEKRARLEALARLRDSGAGLQAGVSMVLQAAQSGELSGVVGPIARLIEVPAEFETAIEVALGGRLQDIVTERWGDAERAVELLKQRRSGRATFQPLDTIRSNANRGKAKAPSVQPGILGVAADLIGFDSRIAPVIQGILGRTLVARDLPATRKALSVLPSGWTIVTLAGEIVRSNGSLTGGAQVRESGTLARERELRQLPGECDEIQAELHRAVERQQAQLEQVATLEARRAKQQALRSEVLEAGREAETALGRLEHRRRDLSQQVDDDERSRSRIDDRVTAIAGERDELDRLSTDLRGQIDELTCRRRELAEILSEDFDQSRTDALQELRARRAAGEERTRSAEEHCRRLHRRQQETTTSLAGLEERLARIDQEATVTKQAVADWQTRLSRLEQSAQRLDAQIAESSAAHQRSKTALEEIRTAHHGLTSRRQSLGGERDRRWLEVERLRDELQLVVERVAHDLGDESEIESRLASGEPVTADEAAKLAPRVERLRERLRRIGQAGEGAIEAFDKESERYRFLRAQLDDVQQAARTLRLMLEELDRSMRQEFDRAFTGVAAEFEVMFQKLFGGGKARLIQSSEDGRQTGIDILAQPPGKRLQNLSLLSGGERSLTAVALLFAIQKVNPSPFCLLDEVDAALDEANVVRLGEELRALSENTQFVVITHNRATIEGADTLYGVSIGADSVSRVLSLRLEQVQVGE